ncbi:MAG TPA: tRNA uracil 4-sulfurtransferase ThiI [bacterium]|jgi:thiamine biosynthesis protein ThiI|nr:tRNA uracil 4-sulfurtransferase ThiI [bacterium]
MFRNILVRYDEIALKKRNRGWFEDLLLNNIRSSVGELGAAGKFRGRMGVELKSEESLKEVVNRLSFIPGISSFSPAFKLPLSAPWDDIVECALKLAHEALSDGRTVIKVICTRSNKRYPGTSIEIQQKLAESVLTNLDGKFTVSMKKYTFALEIEIDTNGIFLFSRKIAGIKGLPSGCAGEYLSLLSGGIDSPVASFMTMRRGGRIHYISFYSPPYTGEESMKKLEDLAGHLKKYQGVSTKLFIAPLIDIQLLIKARCHEGYRTILFRRMMFKIAEKIAIANKFDALITGEALSQVASQTIENLTCINDAVKTLPVIRPLITSEKSDTIAIAEKIGTFPISIRNCPDSCTAFLPKSPIIRGKLEKVLAEEKKLEPEISYLLEESVKNVRVVNV